MISGSHDDLPSDDLGGRRSKKEDDGTKQASLLHGVDMGWPTRHKDRIKVGDDVA